MGNAPLTVIVVLRMTFIRSSLLLMLAGFAVTLAADEPPSPPAVPQPPPTTENPAAPAQQTVLVTAPEPRYVAPTLRDRIGRIWAPVFLNGKGPFRLVLDTGASRSAVIPTVAERLGLDAQTGRRVGYRDGAVAAHRPDGDRRPAAQARHAARGRRCVRRRRWGVR
jgi:hypothetical protein